MFSDIRGKLGGNVFSKGKSGLVVRSRRTANSVYTPLALQQRSQFAFISSFWRSLSEPQQESWHEAAEGKGGFQLFKKCNANRLLVEESVLLEPLVKPQLVDFVVIPNYRINAINQVVFEVSYNYGLPRPEWRLYIMSTGALSSGISRTTESNYRFMTLQPLGEDQSDDIDVSDSWQAIFGSPLEMIGSSSFIKVKAIHKPSGYATPYKQVRTEIYQA